MLIESTKPEKVIGALDPNQTNLLLIGEHTPIDIETIISNAKDQGLTIAGGIFPMVIHGVQSLESGIILKTVPSKEPPILLEGVGEGKLDLQLPDLSGSGSCLVFVDGLMDNIPRLLERLYEKYHNRFHFTGGGAGSLSLQQTPCVFTNKGIFQDAAVIIPHDRPSVSGIKHGWQKIAGPFIANKTDGNKVIELNWRPAFDVYKEIVEPRSSIPFGEDNFFEISKGFPFGIRKERQEVIVRDPIITNPKGELTCVGHVSRNVSLYILEGDREILIDNARKAAIIAIEKGQFEDCLVVDCISRILYLEDQFTRELEAISDELSKSMKNIHPVEGALTLGEISSSIEGLLELYNKTTVVTTFY